MRSVPFVVGFLLVVAVVAPAGAHLDHVTATPQVSPDGTIYVEKAFVSQPMWLVLRSDDGGDAGTPVGHTALDPSDGGTDVRVDFSPGAWANTDGPRTVHVDLYYDDGDGTFDASADRSMAETGPFSTVSFVVRPGDARAYVGVEDFDAQRTAGSAVVRRVVLPGDGHLVIHNLSRGSAAEVVGHVPLRAGEHSDVAVALDDGFYEERPFSFPLLATVYVDDGDGRLDDDDRPVQVGDEVVSSWFQLVKAENASPTPAESDLVTTRTSSDETRDADPSGSLPTAAVEPGFGIAATAIAIAGALAFGWYRSRR